MANLDSLERQHQAAILESLERQMQALRVACEQASTKSSHSEHRLMRADLHLFETVREVQTALADFAPSGDPRWLLRSLREIHMSQVRNT